MAKRRERDTVLIVEDEADILNFSSRVLELEGYCVLKARDAHEGLRLARENRIDLMLLDLKLPGRDGWSVLKETKSKLEPSGISVVVYTAFAGAGERDRAFTMGAADYLVKPLSVASLKETVDRILNRAR